jgi:hypothetical protein
MDFCYVWLRQHLAESIPALQSTSTRSDNELTVNETEGRDICHFTRGLSRVFTTFTKALKPGGPFSFTYHHNKVDAYLPIAVALLDAELVCTTTLPCPAEMGASIHISGTKSSRVDTIFVCRTTGTVQGWQYETDVQTLGKLLRADLGDLRQAGLIPTAGDARCLLLGHLTRLVVWHLRASWKASLPVDTKLAQVEDIFQSIYPFDLLNRIANEAVAALSEIDPLASMRVHEKQETYDDTDEISF